MLKEMTLRDEVRVGSSKKVKQKSMSNVSEEDPSERGSVKDIARGFRGTLKISSYVRNHNI